MNKLLYHIMEAEGYPKDKLLPFLSKAKDGVEVDPPESLTTAGMTEVQLPKRPEMGYAYRNVAAPVSLPQSPAPVASKPSYKGMSIVDYLKNAGVDSSKANRKKLAQEFGIKDYDYSAAKNLELLGRLYDVNEDEEYAAQVFRAAEEAQKRQEVIAEQKRQLKAVQPKVVYDIRSSAPQMVTPPPPAKRPAWQYMLNDMQMPMPGVTTGQFSNMRQNPALSLGASPRRSSSSVNTTSVKGSGNSTNAAPSVVPKPAGQPMVMPPQQNPLSFLGFNPGQLPDLSRLPKTAPTQNTETKRTEDKDNRNWFQKLYDDFSEAVESNPYLRNAGTSWAGTGVNAKATKEMNKDLTIGMASLLSDNLGAQAQNYYARKDALANMGADPKSRIFIPENMDDAPMYATGDTLWDSKRQYHIPESMDLNALRFGVRNRGDMTPIETEAASITAFHPFQRANQYFSTKKDDPANATYLGVTNDGQVKVGSRKDFEGTDVNITRVFSNKVVDFDKDASGTVRKVPAGAKVNKNAFSPAVKVLGDDGKVVSGKLNLVVPQGNNADDAFGKATGGRFIFQTPDGKSRLVSGSLNNIAEEFTRFKGSNPYVNVISLDNGSFSRGLRTKDQKLTSRDLEAYDNLNTGGGNFAYLLPNQPKTRPEAKFLEFENQARKILQSKFPGKKVEIGYQNEGLYDKKGFRDVTTQQGIKDKGNSQTAVSLHNFDAARDYILYVDGKPISADDQKALYKEVLWGAADKSGVYHLEDWDPTHISLAKEGQKTAIDELKAKYPEVFNTPNFKKTVEFIMKNKNKPEYADLAELLTNIQPFTGQPRVLTPKKAFGGSMLYDYDHPLHKFVGGGYLDIFDDGGEDPPGNMSVSDMNRTMAYMRNKAGIATPVQMTPAEKVRVSGVRPVLANNTRENAIARRDYWVNNQNKQNTVATPQYEPATIKPAEKRSAASKAWAIATHPMTALAYKMPYWSSGRKAPDLPDYFERGETNRLEAAADILNPAFYINSTAEVGKGLGRIAREPSSVLQEAPGLFWNSLGMLPVAGEAYMFGQNMVPYVKEGASAAKTAFKATADLPFGTRVRNAANAGALKFPIQGDVPGHAYFNMTPDEVKKAMATEMSDLPKGAFTKDGSMSNNSAPLYWTQAARSGPEFQFVRTGETQSLNRAGVKGKRVSQAIPDEAYAMPEFEATANMIRTEINNLKQLGTPSALERAADLEKNGFGRAALETLTDQTYYNKPEAVRIYNQFLQNYKPTLDAPIAAVNKRTGLNFPMTSINRSLDFVQPTIYAVKGNPLQRISRNFADYGKERFSRWYLGDTFKNKPGNIDWSQLPDPPEYLDITYAQGGEHGGLDRWFAEKWVDIKTGKPCGRQNGEDRGYPACRPSRRVSSQTPKTSSEMSPSEKAKFKRTKTSSERIPYNHKRK